MTTHAIDSYDPRWDVIGTDRKRLNILAVLFGRSNMGHGLPEAYLVKPYKDMNHVPTIEELVDGICGEFSETVEDFDGRRVDTLTFFYEEAHSWVKQLDTVTWYELERIWPDHAKFYKEL